MSPLDYITPSTICNVFITLIIFCLQVQNIFCSCKLVAVAIIIGGGLYKLCEGSYDHVSTGFR